MRAAQSTLWAATAALAIGLALSGCGGGNGSGAVGASGSTASTATTLSQAQQTVGSDLLPPDPDIAGTSAIPTEMAADDLPPDSASGLLDDDLLPPA